MNGLVRSSLRSFVASVTVALAAVACSQQGEGARCDLAAGTSGQESDCADGLVCTDATALEFPKTSLCCPADGTFTTPGCTPKGAGGATTSTTTTSTTATTTVTGTGAGGTGAGGTGGGGTGAGGTGTGTGGSGTGAGGSGTGTGAGTGGG